MDIWIISETDRPESTVKSRTDTEGYRPSRTNEPGFDIYFLLLNGQISEL